MSYILYIRGGENNFIHNFRARRISISKSEEREKGRANMVIRKVDEFDVHNRRLRSELKLYVNQRLYDRGVITEDMYTQAKDLLVKQTV